MKFILILAFISMAAAAAVHTGSSTQTRSQDDQGNYSFGYEENHKEGGSHRKETRFRDGRVVGYYGYTDENGLSRLVHYQADDNGFRASLASNEQGIVAKAPASVNVAVPDGVAYAPTHENSSN